MNVFVATGRLTRDVELKHTAGGKQMAKFSLAVDRGTKDAEGNKQTDFFDCTCWGQTAEYASKYLGKGRRVGVEGRIELNKAAGQDGIERTYVNVIANRVEGLDSAKDAQGGNDASAQPKPAAQQNTGNQKRPASFGSLMPEADDDDPFADQ